MRYLAYFLILIATAGYIAYFLILDPVGTLHFEKFTGKVVGITDVDTVRVMYNGQAKRISLWGINCPAESPQPLRTRAEQFTSQIAFGKVVTVQVNHIDRYGRADAEIILPDGRNLNHELVRAGLARWTSQYALHDRALSSLETEARDARRGLWAIDWASRAAGTQRYRAEPTAPH